MQSILCIPPMGSPIRSDKIALLKAVLCYSCFWWRAHLAIVEVCQHGIQGITKGINRVAIICLAFFQHSKIVLLAVCDSKTEPHWTELIATQLQILQSTKKRECFIPTSLVTGSFLSELPHIFYSHSYTGFISLSKIR